MNSVTVLKVLWPVLVVASRNLLMASRMHGLFEGFGGGIRNISGGFKNGFASLGKRTHGAVTALTKPLIAHQ